jgi:DNA polymerase-1
MTRDRVLLLDGHSLAYRAFFALPPENFTTTTGQPTNAVYGFTSMLLNVLRDEKPSHVVVAFDISRTTFRTEMYPEYKATRSASPPEFKGQVELIKEVLAALNITVVDCPNFEADDIIATLTTRALASDHDVLIMTGDRDSFQLVDEHTTVLYPRKGTSDLARMTPAAVEEKYGLTPIQYADYAALRGDPSDNLPGIPGVGEKTAAKWIREYGSLAALIDNADGVGGKVGESLRANLAHVILNRDLTELRHDAPIDTDPSLCRLVPYDAKAVDELFTALQFRALRDRLASALPATEGATPQTVPAEEVVVDATVIASGKAGAWLKGKSGAVAFRGTWGRGTGVIGAIAVCDATGSVGLIDFADANNAQAACEWLSDESIPKDIHDAKGPMLALLSRGFTLRGLRTDTAIGAYLIAPDQRSFALSDAVQRILGIELTTAESSDQLLFDDASSDDLPAQAVATAKLAVAVRERLTIDGTLALLDNLEIPLISILAEMEFLGIAVDPTLLDELSSEFGHDMRVAEEAAHQIVGRPFNLGSPKQLQEILFTERGLPKTKKIKTGFTTDAESLQWLYATTNDPLLERLLAWRDRSKLRQTVDGLIPLADPAHRIHTTLNQTVAATGRLSSADPNLQNIPIRTDAGRRIRGCFVVGEGFESLMTADYSQIEMRIMAHASADAGLIAAFTEGEDLHTTVASQVFGVKAADVDAEMRRRIKAMSYGLAYGLSAYGLSSQLDISPPEAQRLMDSYFERFGGVRDYLDTVVTGARATGFTETMFGRRRYLPDLTSDNRQRREMAERMALNAPIQGTAADIVKRAMLALTDSLAASGLRSRMLLQVHDELVLEVAPGEAADLEVLVRVAMGGAADLQVPLDVSVGVGRSWEEAAH